MTAFDIGKLLKMSTRAERERFFAELTPAECREWHWHWRAHARPEQFAPQGDWHLWLLLAGRGFGKTRAGAEWVSIVAESDPASRIALVAANLDEARSIMIEGESGLLAVGAPWRKRSSTKRTR
jgi:phage terminase large subunit-like protein